MHNGFTTSVCTLYLAYTVSLLTLFLSLTWASSFPLSTTIPRKATPEKRPSYCLLPVVCIYFLCFTFESSPLKWSEKCEVTREMQAWDSSSFARTTSCFRVPRVASRTTWNDLLICLYVTAIDKTMCLHRQASGADCHGHGKVLLLRRICPGSISHVKAGSLFLVACHSTFCLVSSSQEGTVALNFNPAPHLNRYDQFLCIEWKLHHVSLMWQWKLPPLLTYIPHWTRYLPRSMAE